MGTYVPAINLPPRAHETVSGWTRSTSQQSAISFINNFNAGRAHIAQHNATPASHGITPNQAVYGTNAPPVQFAQAVPAEAQPHPAYSNAAQLLRGDAQNGVVIGPDGQLANTVRGPDGGLIYIPLPAGPPAILIDPGSVGSLAGWNGNFNETVDNQPLPNSGRSHASMPPLQTFGEAAPAQAAVRLPTPVIFDGDDTTCSMCIQDFEHGERVCRLRCGHVHHATCWTHYAASNTETPCPNCRGQPIIIAIWTWIDHSRVTQYLNGTDGPQVDNQLDNSSPPIEQLGPVPHDITTPRSMQTTLDFQTPRLQPAESPRSGSSQAASQAASMHVVIPSTFRDFNDWMSTNIGTGFGQEHPHVGLQPHAGSTRSFHTETRLSDGRPAILIDPGSVGNLGSDEWAQTVASTAIRHHRKPEQKVRDRPLDVSGVGNGKQTCTHNCTLPIALQRLDGSHSGGTFEIPVVNRSNLPGLLGLQALRSRNGILDLKNLQLHLCGPGEYDLQTCLPPGTESFQCELAPSGHMVLPCCNYAGVDREESGRLDTGPALTLVASSSSSL